MNRPLIQTASLFDPLAHAAAARHVGTAAQTVRTLCLFALLGLVVSAAVLPHVAPDTLTWVFSHIE